MNFSEFYKKILKNSIRLSSTSPKLIFNVDEKSKLTLWGEVVVCLYIIAFLCGQNLS